MSRGTTSASGIRGNWWYDPDAHSEIRNVTGKDFIPALADPAFLELGRWETGYLEDGDRVIGVLDGENPLADGLALPGDRRRMVQIFPTLGLQVGPGRLEATGQVAVWGQNLPLAVGISLGYRLTWGLEPSPDTDLRDLFIG